MGICVTVDEMLDVVEITDDVGDDVDTFDEAVMAEVDTDFVAAA